jgi:hypothetical protein
MRLPLSMQRVRAWPNTAHETRIAQAKKRAAAVFGEPKMKKSPSPRTRKTEMIIKEIATEALEGANSFQFARPQRVHQRDLRFPFCAADTTGGLQYTAAACLKCKAL